MLPKESFDIDTQTGLMYFGIDLLAVMASLGFLNTVVASDLYHSLPIWGQALTVAPLQVLVCFCANCKEICFLCVKGTTIHFVSITDFEIFYRRVLPCGACGVSVTMPDTELFPTRVGSTT